LWYQSDGYDFVLIPYVCTAEPDPAELAEAQQIADTAGLSERMPGGTPDDVCAGGSGDDDGTLL
jgi:hypothetical protein